MKDNLEEKSEYNPLELRGRNEGTWDKYVKHWESYVDKYIRVILDNYAIIGKLEGILVDPVGHIIGYSNEWISEEIKDGKLCIIINDRKSTFTVYPSKEVTDISKELFDFKKGEYQKRMDEDRGFQKQKKDEGQERRN